MGWENLPEDEPEIVVDELPPAPKLVVNEVAPAPKSSMKSNTIRNEISSASKPILETKLVDIAGESEKPKNYLNEGAEKPAFKERKSRGEKFMNTPVDIYEPGFRSDVYEGLVEFFKKRRAEKDKLDRLREKIGLRK